MPRFPVARHNLTLSAFVFRFFELSILFFNPPPLSLTCTLWLAKCANVASALLSVFPEMLGLKFNSFCKLSSLCLVFSYCLSHVIWHSVDFTSYTS